MNVRHEILRASLLAVVAACVAACSGKDPESAPPAGPTIVDEARASADVGARIASLRSNGWNVADWSTATVIEGPHGERGVTLAAERLKAHAELVYFEVEDGKPVVALRPADASSKDAVGMAQSGMQTECWGDPNCAHSCMYQVAHSAFWGCASLDSNPFGYYYVMRYEYGTGDAWITDVNGCHPMCPDNVTESSDWVICGFWPTGC